jgi:hypothetical protein
MIGVLNDAHRIVERTAIVNKLSIAVRRRTDLETLKQRQVMYLNFYHY